REGCCAWLVRQGLRKGRGRVRRPTHRPAVAGDDRARRCLGLLVALNARGRARLPVPPIRELSHNRGQPHADLTAEELLALRLEGLVSPASALAERHPKVTALERDEIGERRTETV